MKNLTIERATDLLAHLKDEYNSRRAADDRTWEEFIARSVKVNNDHNGTEDDLVFIAEDGIEKM